MVKRKTLLFFHGPHITDGNFHIILYIYIYYNIIHIELGHEMGCSPRAELARVHATDRFFFWPINLVFVHLICRVLSVVCMWLHGSCSSYGTMNCDIYI